MGGVVFSKDFRKDIWNRLSRLEVSMRDLKGLVQNRMEISEDMVVDSSDMCEDIVKELRDIYGELSDEFTRLRKLEGH